MVFVTMNPLMGGGAGEHSRTRRLLPAGSEGRIAGCIAGRPVWS